MKSLFRFFYKYHFLFLFILLEFFCFVLIVRNNIYQKASFINSSNYVIASIYDSYCSLSRYFSLENANRKLLHENTVLHNMMKENYKSNVVDLKEFSDSVYSKQYIYQPATVINNSIYKPYNYITLDKGSRHGVEPEMAVISNEGTVGIVKDVSRNYCTVISLLNQHLKISAKIKGKKYFGSVSWNGKDYRECEMNEIPFHVIIRNNDTIVTSGYSSIFPEGIPIGTISSYYKNESSSFYDIRVKLFTDFSRLSDVYIVKNKFKDEVRELESSTVIND